MTSKGYQSGITLITRSVKDGDQFTTQKTFKTKVVTMLYLSSYKLKQLLNSVKMAKKGNLMRQNQIQGVAKLESRPSLEN